MENYTSDSSDSDNNKLVDFSHMNLETSTLDHNLDILATSDKDTISDIETLILNHNRLSVLPENISRFKHLRVLDLSSNGLTILSEVILQCPLVSLIIKNNQLTNESLPKSFSLSNTLKELNLSGNRLTAFPDQLLELSALKYLYLGGNKIANVSKEIWKMTNLQILSLGGNQLQEVPATVGELHFLQALVLCDNQIHSLPATIANLRLLKSLLLNKNQLKTLPPEIVTLKNLTELSLRDNPLVVRFVSDMTYNPASLLELAARVIKVTNISIKQGDVPQSLQSYLNNGHCCVNPKCKGVFFDNRVEHIKFVDFCGKYRIPLLQYLCSSKCITGTDNEAGPSRAPNGYLMRKVLLG